MYLFCHFSAVELICTSLSDLLKSFSIFCPFNRVALFDKPAVWLEQLAEKDNDGNELVGDMESSRS